MTVRAKLMPVAIGIVNENDPEDNALNITSAEVKISTKAIATWILIRKPIHDAKLSKTIPFNLTLIMAAPDTFSIAYKKQYKIALIMINSVLLFRR